MKRSRSFFTFIPRSCLITRICFLTPITALSVLTVISGDFDWVISLYLFTMQTIIYLLSDFSFLGGISSKNTEGMGFIRGSYYAKRFIKDILVTDVILNIFLILLRMVIVPGITFIVLYTVKGTGTISAAYIPAILGQTFLQAALLNFMLTFERAKITSYSMIALLTVIALPISAILVAVYSMVPLFTESILLLSGLLIISLLAFLLSAWLLIRSGCKGFASGYGDEE